MVSLVELIDGFNFSESTDELENLWKQRGYTVERRGSFRDGLLMEKGPYNRETDYIISDRDKSIELTVEETVSYKELDGCELEDSFQEYEEHRSKLTGLKPRNTED